MASVSEELTRLAALRDQGVLTDTEFETQKAAVLNGGAPAAPAEPSLQPTVTPAKPKGCLIALAVVVGLIVLVLLIGGGDGSGTSSPTAAAPVSPPIAVTATELFDAYQSNEAAAQNSFGDRPLLVSGVVDGVDLDLTNEPVVKLRTSNQFMNAQAELTEASQARAGSLAKGQSVKLLCTNVGEVIGTPMLKGCELQ